MKIIDISREFMSAELGKGVPAPVLEPYSQLDFGDESNLSLLKACLHTSTHAVAPRRVFADGDGIDRLPLELFIGSCKVISIDEPPVTGAESETIVPFDCERVLFKCEHGAFLHESAAYGLARDGIKLIGVDSPSIGGGLFDAEVYKALLSYNVAIIENLDLSGVTPGNYYIFASPVKIADADSAPCRAVLIDNSK